MADPYYIWPLIKAANEVAPCLEAVPNATIALSEDASLFGLQIQAVSIGDVMPVITREVRWLEVANERLRPRQRQDLSSREKEALIDVIETRSSFSVQTLMKNLPEPLLSDPAPTLVRTSAIITREGVLLCRDATRRVGKDAAWSDAYRAEQAMGATALAECADLDLGLRLSGQAATLCVTDYPALSSHQVLARLVRLREFFERSLQHLSALMPRDAPFRLHPEWKPPA